MIIESPKVGIKYCGGCNSRYDRSDFVKKLICEFEGRASFENVKEGNRYDVLIVVCGCVSSCACYDQYGVKENRVVIVHNEHDAYTVHNKLNELLNYKEKR